MGIGYATGRMPLYFALWLVSAIVLGLTAFRLHHTRSLFHFHENIVIELLVTSLLTLLWVPYALFSLFRFRRNTAATGTSTGGATHWPGIHRQPEAHGNLILWLLWLVGAAIFTNTWPTFLARHATGQTKIMTAIEGFSWIAWSLLTLIWLLHFMHHSASTAVGGTQYGNAGSGHRGGILSHDKAGTANAGAPGVDANRV